MKLLSRTEEMILLSVLDLGKNAYGVAIRKHLRELTGKKYSVGAIYVPLERLEDKGLLIVEEGEPTAERGGRSKRFFHLTAEGRQALENVRILNQSLWKNYPNTQSRLRKNLLEAVLTNDA